MGKISNVKPESIKGLIDNMPPEIYENLKTSIEIGKWPDGKKLDKTQLEDCMQILILYESRYFRDESKTGKMLAGCESRDDILSVISLVDRVAGEET
jgi:hypothetical protein